MSNENRSSAITHSPLSSAVWTGLEPATPCVTGRYSNQLNYHTKVFEVKRLVPFSECKVRWFFAFVQIYYRLFLDR